jgi:hypothetical protein
MFQHKMASKRLAFFKAAVFRASYALSEKMGYSTPRKVAIYLRSSCRIAAIISVTANLKRASRVREATTNLPARITSAA